MIDNLIFEVNLSRKYNFSKICVEKITKCNIINIEEIQNVI